MADKNSIDILADRVNRMACSKCGKVLDVSHLPSFYDVDCPNCQMRQKVPAIFGPFLLAEQLGMGGMGAVYRAVDQALGRFVAIKVMKQQLGADKELVESFLREARAAAALNHPNIVQIYSCGQEKGQPYIAMELVAGGRLDQMMDGGKKVDEVRLLQIALDVAEGLKAADGIHLVHGDIKPANILFDQYGTSKVVDFGLAQFVNRQQEQGGIWGTPYYISPERAKGGKADHRSDIYSLGATMFHALTGIPPFDGKTATDVVVARLKGPPPNILELEPSLSPATAKLVERMMAADPVLRYPTSASLLADMRNALSAAKLARMPGSRAKKKQKLDVGHVVVMAVAGLFMIGASVMVVKWFKQAPPPPAPVVGGPAASLAGALTATNQAPAVKEEDLPDFSAEAADKLAQVLGSLTGRPPSAVSADLKGAFKSYASSNAPALWLGVLKAVPAWIEGDVARASNTLEMVIKQPVEGLALLPKNLALTLNDAPEGDQPAEIPDWYPDLASGIRGFKDMASGDFTAAATGFDAYLKSTNTGPAWALALRPTAKVWTDKMAAWESERQRLLALVDAGKIAEAREAANAGRTNNPPFSKAIWDSVDERGRELQKIAEEKARAEREAQRLVLAEQEKLLVTDFMATNKAFMGAAKNYRGLRPVLNKFASELKQPESRAYAAVFQEHLERLEGLKKLLERTKNDPYRGPKWDVTSADPINGLRIVQDRIIKWYTWDKVPPKVMAQIASSYAEQEDELLKADIYLSLALFALYSELPREDFEKYRDLAKAPGGKAEESARRLLPTE